MARGEAARPYGPAYQEMCARAAVAAGCKGNAMGVLYCLFMQSGLWDWNTGQTVREISHKDVAKAMGGIEYKTVQKAITELRKAGVMGYADHRGRGTVWSDGTGHANRYKLLLPPKDPTQKTGTPHQDPPQKTGTPPPKKRADPYPKNGYHYHSSIYSNGEDAAASRGEADKVPDPHRGGEPATLVQLTTRHGYAEARRIWEAAEFAENASMVAAE